MFLSANEIALMQSDFSTLLNSPEATTVRFWSMRAADPLDSDDVFHVEDGELEEVSFTGKAIQHFVKPQDEQLLKFGIVEAGDCIFFTSTDYDLQFSGCIEGAVTIDAPYPDNSVSWTPVPRERKEFFNYLITRLGNNQFSQVIPCKLKK